VFVATRVTALLAPLALLAPAAAGAQVLEVSGDGTVRELGAAIVRQPEPASPREPTTCTGSELGAAFEAAAARHGLSVDLLMSVARAESGCDADAVSPAGAVGVMQLLPETARELGVDPRDPRQNIDGGAAYLRQQIDRFGGRLDLALAAYNAGPAPVERHDAVPPYSETRRYVGRNLDLLAERSLSLSEETHP
jgi:soluble lytic murein transglycosylase-like protein